MQIPVVLEQVKSCNLSRCMLDNIFKDICSQFLYIFLTYHFIIQAGNTGLQPLFICE